MQLDRQRIIDEAGPQLAGRLLGTGRSAWRGVSLHVHAVSRPWQCNHPGSHIVARTERFATEEEAAAWTFAQHYPELLPDLLALQPTYPPLVAVQQHARVLGAPLRVAQQLAAAQQPQQQGQQPQLQPSVGSEPLLLQQLLAADPLPAAPAAGASQPSDNDAQQRTDPQAMAFRLRLHLRRALALLATLTALQLLPDTVLLPVLCHCLLGLSLESACSVYDALAAAAGMGGWRDCHLDHVLPLALQEAQTQLGRGVTLRNLRPLRPAVNVAIGSRGLSRVQGRAGLPPLCRHLPGGQPASAEESQQAIAAVEAEARQHEAALDAELQRSGLHPAACECGPCRLTAAPDQPFASLEQAAEVRRQQWWALWICACAKARGMAATRVPGYSQPWSMSAFLRHGGTGCSELYMPLVPPMDGFGAGMDAQLADQLAPRAVRLYMQLSARRRETAGLAALPQADAAAAAADLRRQLQQVLVARRRGGEAERELSQAEEAEELAWAAEWEGQEAEARRLAAEAAAMQPAASRVRRPAPARLTLAASLAAAAAAAEQEQQEEAERQRLLRQEAVQRVEQYRAQHAQQAQQPEQQRSYLPPSVRRPAQKPPVQVQPAQQLSPQQQRAEVKRARKVAREEEQRARAEEKRVRKNAKNKERKRTRKLARKQASE